MRSGHPISAFLSHSSADKSIVTAVHDALRPGSTWLDRAEIEWGARFIESIETGIQSASDFVLFWSAASSRSPWVRHETHMALILKLQQRAIRIRIVRLDDTDLPLHLKPFHFLSVAGSDNPIEDILSELRPALAQPTHGARHRFLNRNDELGRIEALINDTETRVILLHGFKGVGKAATVSEALRRFYEGASSVEVTIRPGTGVAEVALQLNHEAFGTVLPESTALEALAAIEASLAAIVERGQFIVLKDCQHWFSEDGDLDEPLPSLIRHLSSLAQTSAKPAFFTSTRRPRIAPDVATHLSSIRLPGLSRLHMASLVALWYETTEGKSLDADQASSVAAELHGHPIAAKLAANLIAQHGAERALRYPAELVALRRDLAKTLIRDLNLSSDTTLLMETLSIVGAPLPSTVLAQTLQMDDIRFHKAVDEATRAGIAEAQQSSSELGLHPLLSDYFWRSHLDHSDYTKRAQQVVAVVHDYMDRVAADSSRLVTLLPPVCRLYALAGEPDKAQEIRRGLTGELSQAAITHYNRRKYDLAERLIGLVLETEPKHWRMRMYKARIHIRKNRWNEADELIAKLLRERSRDQGVQHLRGWRFLRAGSYREALPSFARVLAKNDRHVASYRDSAYCLYRLGRPQEALKFLRQARDIESDNPFALDLEARIYEEMGRFDDALSAARTAIVRHPLNWGLRHRHSRILAALGERDEALQEAREAVALDPAQFVALSNLMSLLIDADLVEEAANNQGTLRALAVGQKERDICEHIHARIAFRRGELDEALDLVQRQINRRRNLAASYGLLSSIRLVQADRTADGSATARVHIAQAEEAIVRCEEQADHDREAVEALRARLVSVRGRLR